MDERGQRVLTALRASLVVSCQAYPGEPLRAPGVMPRMAQAVVRGGARAVRLQGVEDVRGARARVDVPIIGLWKDGHDGVYITPTLEHAVAVADAGADVVAVDGTPRPRPDGRSLAQTVSELTEHRDVLVMADCDTLESAQAAVAAGADLIGTTLAGYTPARARSDGPDLELLSELVTALPGTPVVAEGRIHTPADAAAALQAGAHAVVVGTAITHPTTVTGWFVQAIANASVT